MGNVINLNAYRNRHERALLADLLALSDQIEIRGLAICLLTDEGELVHFTGQFQSDSSHRLLAALKLSKHLNEWVSYNDGSKQ